MFEFLQILLGALAAPNDLELAARLKQRDPQAMGGLYDRYGRQVYSLILRIVRDAGVAEDLTQEAFLRIWNRAHFLDEERGTLGAWVLAVARNRAIDYLRSVDGRMRHSSTGFEANDHPDAFVNLERDAVRGDEARRLRAALEKLNPNQREVIELAYYEGLSQTEMAERMKQPLGTVKTWVRAALKALRAELGEALPA